MTMPDVGAEAVLIAAGGRAILLQLADPAVGHGVAHHSDFVSRPLDRLHGTLSYVYAVAFGTAEEAATAVNRVNRAHSPVRGPAGKVSPAYSAFTPELQLWVVATLYDSAMLMHEYIFGPPQPALADELYREYAALGTSLQLPIGLWPSDRLAFERYWRERLGMLRTDATTRRVADRLLHPRAGPVWLRAAMPLARLLTAGLLPPDVRGMFELRWTAKDQRRFDRFLCVTARVYPLLSRRLRHWPKNHYLRALRRTIPTLGPSVTKTAPRIRHKPAPRAKGTL